MPGRAMQGSGHGSFTVASPSSTLDELLQQVEELKQANARLQSELAGDASHLARLEGEAAQRKDALLLLMLDRSAGAELAGGSGSNGALQQLQQQHASQQPHQRHDAPAAAVEPALVGRGSFGSPRAGQSAGGSTGSPRAGASRSLAGSPAAAAAGLPPQREQQQLLSSEALLGYGNPAARRGLHLYAAATATHSAGKTDQASTAPRRLGQRSHLMETDGDYHAAAERLRGWAGSDSSITTFDAGSRGGAAAGDDSGHKPSYGSAQTLEDARVKKEKRDSGTYDHIELEKDGLLLRDASTNTTALGEAFVSNSSVDMDSSSETGLMTYGPRGAAVVTIGTQTTDVVVTSNGKSVDSRVEGGVASRPDGVRQHSLASVYHGAWPIAHGGRWSCNGLAGGSAAAGSAPETQSVISFHSGMSSSHRSGSTSGKNLVAGGAAAAADSAAGAGAAAAAAAYDSRGDSSEEQRQLGSKVEVVYSLLSMLGTHDPDDASRTLLAMSNSPDSCVAMRQTGCLPLLVQLLHGTASVGHEGGGGGESTHARPSAGAVGRAGHAARGRAARALRNIVRSHPDEKKGWREARVLHNLELLRQHCDRLTYQMRIEGDNADEDACSSDEDDDDVDSSDVWRPNNAKDYQEVSAAISALMKLSFDEDSRQAICTLGGLQAVAEFIVLDSSVPASFSEASRVTLRRYACMTLTNLTFGDCTNKTLLCSIPGCLRAIVQQLQGFNEDICQVAASVLRNLSWRADRPSKVALRQADAPRRLTEVALQVRKESSLKSILSALWNLSAHCSENKMDICAVDGALPFLVGALSYRSPSKTLAIVESAGGVLRNVSSVIAVREDLRRLLRRHDYLRVLLAHLRSPSLTVVGNACGALWNISARCREDQVALRDMGAVDMLHSLVTSKHRLISTGAAAALKNLLAAEQRATSGGGAAKAGQPQQLASSGTSGDQVSAAVKVSLAARRQRQRDETVNEELSDTCDNLDGSPQGSPRELRRRHAFAGGMPPAAGDRTAVRGAVGSSSAMAASLLSQLCSDGQSPSWHTLVGEGRKVDSGAAGASAARVERSTSEDSVEGSGQHEGRASRQSPASASSLPFASLSGSAQSVSKLEQLMKEVMQQASAGDSAAAAAAAHGASLSLPSVARSGGLKGAAAAPQATLGLPLSSRSLFRSAASTSATAASDGGGSVLDRMARQGSRIGALRDPFVVNPALSPRVTKTAPAPGSSEQLQSPPASILSNYFAGLTSSLPQGALAMAPGALGLTQGSLYSPTILSALPQYCGLSFASELSSPRSGAATRPFCHGGDDDDNCSEKPIDYSRRYAEQPSATYEQKRQPALLAASGGAAAVAPPTSGLSAAAESPGMPPAGGMPGPATAAPGSCGAASEKVVNGELSTSAFKCKAEDDAFGDQDQLQTFCTEGTPMNFLSTATSMNELNRMCFGGDDAQMGVLEEESSDKPAALASAPRSLSSSGSGGRGSATQPSARTAQPPSLSADKPAAGGGGGRELASLPRRLPSDAFDDSPIVYATEDTPLSFSRVSSLSNLSSGIEGLRIAAAGGERAAGSAAAAATAAASAAMASGARAASVPPASLCLQIIREHEAPGGSLTREQPGSAERLAAASLHPPTIDVQQQQQQHLHHKTVTFSDRGPSAAAAAVQETPMMFSRASSLGSLSSFDAQSVHSSVVSEYSRRASEVVSPSDLPDSPGETAPSTPRSTAKQPTMFQSRVHGLISCDARPPLAAGVGGGASATAASAAPAGGGARQPLPAGGARLRISVATYLDDELARPFADEGTPDNGSVRSGLSALTFADDENEKLLPPPPLPPRVPRLYAALRGGAAVTFKEDPSSVGVAVSREPAPLQPSAMSTARDAEGHPRTAVVQAASEGVGEQAKESGKPASGGGGSSGAERPDASDGPAAARSEAQGARAERASSSSSSEGDEDMLEQCISSALPGGRRRTGGAAASLAMKKSASDQTVGSGGSEGGGRPAAAGASSAASVPRSKTFGSKLRVPLSKAKMRRQAPALPSAAKPSVSKVGANSPTPDDDQLLAAEDCMRTFATEDTPNNFSTATSLSDLSVLDEPRESMASTGSSATLAASMAANQDVRDGHELSSSCDDDGDSSSSSSSSSSDDDGDDDVLSLAISSAIPKRKGGKPEVSESGPPALSGKLPGAAGHPAVLASRPVLGGLGHVTAHERTAAVGCEDAAVPAVNQTAARNGGGTPSASLVVPPAELPVHLRSQIPRPQATSAVGDSRHAGARRGPAAPGSLKSTGNELRPGELRSGAAAAAEAAAAVDAADFVQVYATEGTPHNFSNATSLSDLTIDSHYSTGLARPSAGTRMERSGPLQPHPARPAAAAAARPPRAAGQGLPPALASAVIHHGHGAGADGDSVRAYDLEGTPFSHSRRDSLSSLSCDDGESCDGRSKTGRDAVAPAARPRGAVTAQMPADGAATAESANSVAGGSQPLCHSAHHQKKPPATACSAAASGAHLPAASAVGPWRQPPSAGSGSCLSRDEELLKFTPVEGTPYCFSRGSPLSSLGSSSAGDGSEEAARAGDGSTSPRLNSDSAACDDDDEAFHSIDAAHKAESLAASALAGRRRVGALQQRRTSSSSSSSSGSEAASNVSVDSCDDEAEFSSAFLNQCIASAMPRKTGESGTTVGDAKAPCTAAGLGAANATTAATPAAAAAHKPSSAPGPPLTSASRHDKGPIRKEGGNGGSSGARGGGSMPALSCSADGRTATAAAVALSQLVSCRDSGAAAAPKQSARDCYGTDPRAAAYLPPDAGRSGSLAARANGGSSSSDGLADTQGPVQKHTSRRGSSSQRKE